MTFESDHHVASRPRTVLCLPCETKRTVLCLPCETKRTVPIVSGETKRTVPIVSGEVEASNNQVENAQRGVVVGRKNWLFCDTPKGAEASVIAYSILETAKANGLNPEKYLMHIFSVLPDRFAKNPKADIEDLLPWNDEIKELCKMGA